MSRFTLISSLAFSTQSLLLEEEVNKRKRHVRHLFENELLPAVEHAVKMDVLEIKKYKNELKHCKLERIFKQTQSLARCLESGLTDSELVLILLVTEKQKLIDMADLYKQCCEEINEEYCDFTLRMVRVTLFSFCKGITHDKGYHYFHFMRASHGKNIIVFIL